MIKNDLYPEVVMPKASVGVCKNSRNCKAYATDLADGWCINCWDKGPSAKKNIEVTIKRREEKKKLKGLVINGEIYRTETRGRHKRDCNCDYHTNKGFV